MSRARSVRPITIAITMTIGALAACGGSHQEPAEGPSTVASGAPRKALVIPTGEWSLMRFLGGPPPPGQITDTLRFKGGSLSDGGPSPRHVRVERSRAGGADTSCEVDAADDAAWRSLAVALADSDLQSALSHPDRVPMLVIDAGYFTCKHGAASTAVSDLAGADAEKKPEVRALQRLSSAYASVLSEVVTLPACASAL